MILLDKTTKEQFKLFYEKNKIDDIEKLIEYFTIFGGYDIKLDTTKPLNELIETHILNNYEHLRKEVNSQTGGYGIDHAVLSGIALGDRKTTTAFKRAHVSSEEGMKSIENLVNKGVIETESSKHFLTKKRSTKTAQKLIITTPYLRFWFAFISPIYKGIKEGKYEEFYKKFEARKSDFSDFIFEELALEYLDTIYKDDPLNKLGKYWDDKNQVDLVAKTKSGKIIAGNCRYVNAKMKKSELNKLTDTCKNIGLEADTFVLFTKTSYTTELKALKSENLKLFNAKSLKALYKD